MSLEVKYPHGSLSQTATERRVYPIELSEWSEAPVSGEVLQVIDESDGGDVTGTVMPTNVCTLSGTRLTTSLLRSLTQGRSYRIEVRFVAENSQWLEFHLRVRCI